MTFNKNACNLASSNAQFFSGADISTYFKCSQATANKAVACFVRGLPKSMWDLVKLDEKGLVSHFHVSLLGRKL